MNRDKILIAFDSTQQALRCEMLLEYADIEIDILPTPKEITAGCALTIEFMQEVFSEVRTIVYSERVVIKGFFQWQNDCYIELTKIE